MTLTFGPDQALEVECSECSSLLDLHQPDTDDPRALVGICPGCGLVHTLALRELVAVELLAVHQAQPDTALRAG